MKRYLVMEAEGWEPDSAIIEADDAGAALAIFRAKSTAYQYCPVIVAEIMLEDPGEPGKEL